jgi:hypothetical protein
LSTGRFTNIHREDDLVTRWIADKWRTPYADDPDLWFAMSVARLIIQPETLAAIGYPVPCDSGHFLAVMRLRAEQGLTLYGGAYMVRSTSSYIGRSKAEYLAEMQFNTYWERQRFFRPRPDDPLAGYHARLRTGYGFADFMAAQVIADLKYVAPLAEAPDWWTFAAPGPGSLKGLNAIYRLDPATPWKSDVWLAKVRALYAANASRFGAVGLLRLHLQDVQNVLREVGKIARVQIGGQLKAGYSPSAYKLPGTEGAVRDRLLTLADAANRRLAAAGIEARYTPDADAFVAIWRKGRAEMVRLAKTKPRMKVTALAVGS